MITRDNVIIRFNHFSLYILAGSPQQREANYCGPVTVSSPHERETTPPGSRSPTLYEEQCGFFYVPFQLIRKYEGDKANGLTSPPNDAII